MCWLSTGDEFHAQRENIKMSDCKNPCKALGKVEYENRYQKSSKLNKFLGNTSLCFKEWGSSFFSRDNLMLGYCYQKRAMTFLIHSGRCGFGTLLSRAPVPVLHGLLCDFLQLLMQLEAPFPSPSARRGSWAGSQGGWHGWAAALYSAGCVGRAGLIDSCHVESYLCL